MSTFFALQNSLVVVLSWCFLIGFARAEGPAGNATAEHVSIDPTRPPQPPPDGEPAGYRALVEEAVREYERGHFEEARTLFSRAHLLFPNARTHRGIGKAEFELRNYEACIEHLEAALGATTRSLTTDLRAETEQLLARARQYFGSLMVETRPATSEVRIDGAPVALVAGKPLSVRVGEHVVEVDAPGYATERREVSVKGGAPERLVVVFARPLPVATKEQPARRWIASPWLWTAVGAVVASAAAGTAVAVSRDREKQGPYDLGSTGILGKAP